MQSRTSRKQQQQISAAAHEEILLSTHGESEASKSMKEEIPGLKDFDLLPNSASVRLPVVAALYASSPATIWRGVKAGRIPQPKRFSLRITAWNVGELREALMKA